MDTTPILVQKTLIVINLILEMFVQKYMLVKIQQLLGENVHKNLGVILPSTLITKMSMSNVHSQVHYVIQTMTVLPVRNVQMFGLTANMKEAQDASLKVSVEVKFAKIKLMFVILAFGREEQQKNLL